MDEKYVYTEKDYEILEEALNKSNQICYGRPDQFQFYQNELTKAIAHFLLLPITSVREKEQQKTGEIISKFFGLPIEKIKKKAKNKNEKQSEM